MQIIQADEPSHADIVRTLFTEYLTWANKRLGQEYAITLDIQATIDQNMRELDIFMPPYGCLLLAFVDGQPSGLLCMKRHTPHIAEIKRMYVRPNYRRRGIGRALARETLAQARTSGYTLMRLDSARFMHGAHTLYRSLGFHEIEPYEESEIPTQYRQHWVFMERPLTDRDAQ